MGHEEDYNVVTLSFSEFYSLVKQAAKYEIIETALRNDAHDYELLKLLDKKEPAEQEET